jgi:hypothetical protein
MEMEQVPETSGHEPTIPEYPGSPNPPITRSQGAIKKKPSKKQQAAEKIMLQSDDIVIEHMEELPMPPSATITRPEETIILDQTLPSIGLPLVQHTPTTSTDLSDIKREQSEWHTFH